MPDSNSELTLLYTTTDDGSRPRGAMSFIQITSASTDEPTFQITNIDIDTTPAAPTNTVTWSSLPGRNYGLLYSTDLVTWEEVDGSIPSEGEFTSFPHQLLPDFTELIGVPRLFYRVELKDN